MQQQLSLFEEWRPVVGYEGWYSVSNLGRVRRDCRGKSTPPGTILKSYTSIYRQGRRAGKMNYPHVVLYGGGRGRTRSVHGLVALAFLGPAPPKYEINHRDGNHEHYTLSNLEYATAAQNMKHAYDNGLTPAPPLHERDPATGRFI